MSPRSKRFRQVVSPPVLKGFQPIGLPKNESKKISLLFEEYEALRLADYSNMKQEEAAKIMKVSRPTFTRIYNSCLKKIAKAFAEGRIISIEGGNVEFDKQWYRCNDCTTVFHHPDEIIKECISCDSDKLENINKSVKDWKENQSVKKSKTEEEFCYCPNCDVQTPRQNNVPCFSQTCPDCSTPLLRKSIV